MAFWVCWNMERRGAGGQQDLAVRLTVAVCTDPMNEMSVESKLVL